MLKIAVVGSTGKVGKEIVKLVTDSPNMTVKAIVKDGSPPLPNDAHRDDVEYACFSKQALLDCDAVIDFSIPDVSLKIIELLKGSSTAVVIGTTGFTKDQEKVLLNHNASFPLLIGSNFTDGFEQYASSAYELADKLKTAKITIGEVYHQNKKKAPSGTTQKLQQTIQLNDGKNSSREIDLNIQRIGETPGINSLKYELGFSTIELKLTVHSRAAYAMGSIKAAEWLVKQQAGLYQPSDIFKSD